MIIDKQTRNMLNAHILEIDCQFLIITTRWPGFSRSQYEIARRLLTANEEVSGGWHCAKKYKHNVIVDSMSKLSPKVFLNN